MQNPFKGTAASGLGETAAKVYNEASSLVNKIPGFGIGESKPDTSWHAEMVREATASFAKPKPTTSHQAGHQRINAKYGKSHSK